MVPTISTLLLPEYMHLNLLDKTLPLFTMRRIVLENNLVHEILFRLSSRLKMISHCYEMEETKAG